MIDDAALIADLRDFCSTDYYRRTYLEPDVDEAWEALLMVHSSNARDNALTTSIQQWAHASPLPIPERVEGLLKALEHQHDCGGISTQTLVTLVDMGESIVGMGR